MRLLRFLSKSFEYFTKPVMMVCDCIHPQPNHVNIDESDQFTAAPAPLSTEVPEIQTEYTSGAGNDIPGGASISLSVSEAAKSKKDDGPRNEDRDKDDHGNEAQGNDGNEDAHSPRSGTRVTQKIQGNIADSNLEPFDVFTPTIPVSDFLTAQSDKQLGDSFGTGYASPVSSSALMLNNSNLTPPLTIQAGILRSQTNQKPVECSSASPSIAPPNLQSRTESDGSSQTSSFKSDDDSDESSLSDEKDQGVHLYKTRSSWSDLEWMKYFDSKAISKHLQTQMDVARSAVTNDEWNVLRFPFSLKKDWADDHPEAEVFTLSAIEDNQGIQFEVPMQRVHIGHQAIPNSTASIPCKTLGALAMLQHLNSISGTAKSLDDHGLASLLNTCIERNYDFGTAYAYLRPRWNLSSSEAIKTLDLRQKRFYERRRNSLDRNGYIIYPEVPPHRVWDLYSNRVVPFWFSSFHGTRIRNLIPISHAWMGEADRQSVQTPINLHEWPVPIPKDTTLERVRIELLNYGFEYVWLDVLCLRQKGLLEKESLRLDEWRLDVPTIGGVYRRASLNNYTFCYFNGLGRPFKIGDLSGRRHWLNRAWTLQETENITVSGGITKSSPCRNTENHYDDDLARDFYKRLDDLQSVVQNEYNPDPCQVLSIMHYRAAESELDKIFGLAYLLQVPIIPTYIVGQDPEEAWQRLVVSTEPKTRGQLLFRVPVAGDGRLRWCPSWQQIQHTEFSERLVWYYLEYDKDQGTFFSKGYRVDECTLDTRGMALEFDLDGDRFRYKFHLCGSTPVPAGSYTLIPNKWWSSFIVGSFDARGRLEKAAVIDCDMRKDQPQMERTLGKTQIEFS